MCHDNHLLSPENISIQYLCHSGLWDVAEQVWTSSTVVIVMLVNLNSRNIIWPIVLYLPQPAWICAASASYWLIRIPNQAARRYLLHVPWWWASSFIFFSFSAIKSFIVYLLFLILRKQFDANHLCNLTSAPHFEAFSVFLFLPPFYPLPSLRVLLEITLSPTNPHTNTHQPRRSAVKRVIESYGGGNSDGWLSLKKAEPWDSWDNKLWMRPPLPSTHTHPKTLLPVASILPFSTTPLLFQFTSDELQWDPTWLCGFFTSTLFFISDSFERPRKFYEHCPYWLSP